MVEPEFQLLVLLVDDTVTKVHTEVGLSSGTDVKVTALVAEVVRRAVAVGEQRRDACRHLDGRGQVTVAQRGLGTRAGGFLDLGQLVLLDRLFLKGSDVLLEGNFLGELLRLVLGVHAVNSKCSQQHGDIYILFHLYHDYIIICVT